MRTYSRHLIVEAYVSSNLSRRYLIGAGCAACAAIASGLQRPATAALGPQSVDGPGYSLSFIGAQRETIMMGRREGRLDLRLFRGQAGLVGLGPLEGLTGEMTIVDGRPSLARVESGQVRVSESFDVSVPFFVWAEVEGWREQAVPATVESATDLERFVDDAGARAGLTRAFPFKVTGQPAKVGFHVLNAPPGNAHTTGMAGHKAIQAQFVLEEEPVILVGFHSHEHQGVFTHMGSTTHIHVQNALNTRSGHTETMEAGGAPLVLWLPRR